MIVITAPLTPLTLRIIIIIIIRRDSAVWQSS